jgi:hypothetical protein
MGSLMNLRPEIVHPSLQLGGGKSLRLKAPSQSQKNKSFQFKLAVTVGLKIRFQAPPNFKPLALLRLHCMTTPSQ